MKRERDERGESSLSFFFFPRAVGAPVLEPKTAAKTANEFFYLARFIFYSFGGGEMKHREIRERERERERERQEKREPRGAFFF